MHAMLRARCDPDLIDELDRLRGSATRSEVIRHALHRFLAAETPRVTADQLLRLAGLR